MSFINFIKINYLSYKNYMKCKLKKKLKCLLFFILNKESNYSNIKTYRNNFFFWNLLHYFKKNKNFKILIKNIHELSIIKKKQIMFILISEDTDKTYVNFFKHFKKFKNYNVLFWGKELLNKNTIYKLLKLKNNFDKKEFFFMFFINPSLIENKKFVNFFRIYFYNYPLFLFNDLKKNEINKKKISTFFFTIPIAKKTNFKQIYIFFKIFYKFFNVK